MWKKILIAAVALIGSLSVGYSYYKFDANMRAAIVYTTWSNVCESNEIVAVTPSRGVEISYSNNVSIPYRGSNT